VEPIYENRREAGRALARHLAKYAGHPDAVVLGLARGGVPIAFEVAHALGVPFDALAVRKLGLPGREELAMGAIASGGALTINYDVVDALDIPMHVLEQVMREEASTLERSERAYRTRPRPSVRDKTVILVDDGLATGSTMKAAVRALRAEHPKRIVVAVPVAPPETCDDLRAYADEIVCAATPRAFLAVGLWYRDFSQVTDDEVRRALQAEQENLNAE
jgi:predicted phosphoribosyltransferase